MLQLENIKIIPSDINIQHNSFTKIVTINHICALNKYNPQVLLLIYPYVYDNGYGLESLIKFKGKTLIYIGYEENKEFKFYKYLKDNYDIKAMYNYQDGRQDRIIIYNKK